MGIQQTVSCEVGRVKSIRVDLDDGDDDVVIAGPADGPPVTASGGVGKDVVEYILAPGRVAVSLDGQPNDGALPGHDNIGADFEAIRTTAKADSLTAGPAGTSLFGLRGMDHMTGGPGNDLIDARDIDACSNLGGDCPEPHQQDAPERDTVHCGAGIDTVDGDAKDKISRDCEFVIVDGTLDLSDKPDNFRAYRTGLSVNGWGGNDRLTGSGTTSVDSIDGGKGNDQIAGLGGPDTIAGGAGRDHISAGNGDDTIRTRDGERDVVTCGTGTDTVTADKKDRVAQDCENVARR
jgi:Ca2+-binding RTX toxin-like protein